jgi:molybdopterin-guanine dinucleotide biosynthesis protein A
MKPSQLYAAAILAGGQSVRMGTPKQLVQNGHATLGSQMLTIARACCDRVLVAGPPGSMPGEAAIADLPNHTGSGPLAGIEAVLATGIAERWLVFPCDMPRLHAADASRLLQGTGAVCCFEDPAAEGKALPLPMAVDASMLASITTFLDTERRAVRGWLDTITCTLVEPPLRETLVNINSPEDLHRSASQQSP